MQDDRRKLRLPGKVAFTTLSIALALTGASCGGDDTTTADAAPPRDAMVADGSSTPDSGSRDSGPTDGAIVDAFMPPEKFFCIYDNTVDSGGTLDAATCSGVVTNPDDCPQGCRAVG